MKHTYTKIALGLLAFTPAITFAQNKTLKDIAGSIVEYLNIGLTLIIGLAVIIFVWNVVKYFFFAEQDRVQAGMYVLYSIIGFFVILSFWGIVAVVRNSLNLDDKKPDTVMFGTGGNGGSSNSVFNGGGNTAPATGNNSNPLPSTSNNSSPFPSTSNNSAPLPATSNNSNPLPPSSNNSN